MSRPACHTLKCLRHSGNGTRLCLLRHIDGYHRAREVHFLLSAVTYDDHLIEFIAVFLHGDNQIISRATGIFRVADVSEGNQCITLAERQSEAAVHIGDSSVLGTLLLDGDADERLALSVDNLTTDSTLLLGG